MIRIGSLYLPHKSFQDEANQTIGAPAISSEVITNRRMVTCRLTDAGKKFQHRVAEIFKTKYGIDVKFRWNIHCGCTMCPCSPGFNILMAKAPEGGSPYYGSRLREEHRFDVWVKDNGRIDLRIPEKPYRMNNILKVNLNA